MATKRDYEDYNEFLKKIGYGQLDGVDVTHDGFPLSVKEAKFIDMFIVTGDIKKAMKEANISWSNVKSKEYIANEITYRLELLKNKTIADADEIMQYFTSVMRGEVKDQFGLDAPLSERTNAARELARRIVDTSAERENGVPEIKVTLNWD